MELEYLIYALAGMIGALLVGLIGTGSSLVIMPALVLIFPTILTGFDTIRLATGTTMATMTVGAIAATISQFRLGNIDLRLLKHAVIPYMLAALCGPWLSRLLPGSALRIYLSVLIAFVAIMMLLRPRTEPSRDYFKHLPQLRVVLFFIALCSSIAGVASGIFTIPYLSRFRLPIKTIIGTSTAGAALYSFFGTLGYISAGWSVTDLPAEAFGFIYLPAFLIMAFFVAIFAPLGVYLARYISEQIMQKGFALFLLLAALAMAVL